MYMIVVLFTKTSIRIFCSTSTKLFSIITIKLIAYRFQGKQKQQQQHKKRKIKKGGMFSFSFFVISKRQYTTKYNILTCLLYGQIG